VLSCIFFLSLLNFDDVFDFNLWHPDAGTLYAGDGVVIQQPEDIRSDFDHGCIAILRYPRSTFASNGNATLCVCCVEFNFMFLTRFFLCLQLVG
jgi:hypothetical protein